LPNAKKQGSIHEGKERRGFCFGGRKLGRFCEKVKKFSGVISMCALGIRRGLALRGLVGIGDFFFDLAAAITVQLRFCLVFAAFLVGRLIDCIVQNRYSHAARHSEVREKEREYKKFAKHEAKLPYWIPLCKKKYGESEK
jgi:hypothetical protein